MTWSVCDHKFGYAHGCKFFGQKPRSLDRRLAQPRPSLAGASSWPGWCGQPSRFRCARPWYMMLQALTWISPLIYHRLLFSQLVNCPHRFVCADSVLLPSLLSTCRSASPVPIGVPALQSTISPRCSKSECSDSCCFLQCCFENAFLRLAALLPCC